MTTPNSMIRQALGLIGARAPGESVGGDEITDCWEAFLRLLDTLALEGLIQRWEGAITFGTLPGQSEYVISAEAGQATPVGLFSIGISDGSNEWSLEKVGRDRLLDIDRGENGRPISWTEYVKDRTLTVSLNPAPDKDYSVIANIKHGIFFSDVNDDVLLPVGYESMLIPGLAIAMAPLYEREAPPSVVAAYRNAKSSIRRMNWQGISPQNDMVSVR